MQLLSFEIRAFSFNLDLNKLCKNIVLCPIWLVSLRAKALNHSICVCLLDVVPLN